MAAASSSTPVSHDAAFEGMGFGTRVIHVGQVSRPSQ